MSENNFEKVIEVFETTDKNEANAMLSNGWILLNVTSKCISDEFRDYEHFYSLGRVKKDSFEF